MTCIEFREHPAADQVVAEPLERIDLLEYRFVHGGEVVAGEIEQPLPVGIRDQPEGA